MKLNTHPKGCDDGSVLCCQFFDAVRDHPDGAVSACAGWGGCGYKVCTSVCSEYLCTCTGLAAIRNQKLTFY